MNRISFILFIICMPFLARGQELVVQSNNAVDLEQYEPLIKTTNINQLITKLGNVVSSSPDYNSPITIQVTLLDPYTLGGFKLKTPHINSINYTDIWENTYADEDRIMFLFEKNDNRYVFKDFVITQKIEDGQIPEIVRNYIQEEILEKQTNITEIVSKGINAVKNAYDRSFQNAMINKINNLLTQKKYYKGYAYFSTNWFNFERIKNNNELPYDLEKLYELKHREGASMEYVEAPVQSVNSLLANMNNLFVCSHCSSISQTEIATLRESIYFEDSDLLANTDPFGLYSQGKDSILSDIYAFEEWEYVKQGGSRKLEYTFEPEEKALSQKYKIKVIQGQIPAEGEVDEINGFSNWGYRFQYNQPTWCNQFARDLTQNTYKKNDYILASKSAAGLNADFNSETTIYKKLPDDNDASTWKSYINKGYLVLFSDNGHIEIGFPDNTHYQNQRKRHPEDTRYPNSSDVYPNNKTKLTIGAGSTVGYKLSDWAASAQIFIYLEHLHFEN